MLPENLARSIISKIDSVWKRSYQLHIDGNHIMQPVLSSTGELVLNDEGNPQYSNPKIHQLKIDDSVRGEFANLQDKTVLYRVRLIRHENYNHLISSQYDWELSFDGGQTYSQFEVIQIETSAIEDFAWIILLGA